MITTKEKQNEEEMGISYVQKKEQSVTRETKPNVLT